MQIILLEDVKTLGKKGQIVNVNDGYARNYILPKKLGMEATNKNINDLKLQKANEEKIAQEILDEARAFAADLATKEVKLQIKAGESGKAFGSISTKEIAKAAADQLGIEIDKKKMVLPDPIKTQGEFEIPVKVHPKVTAKLKVTVTVTGA